MKDKLEATDARLIWEAIALRLEAIASGNSVNSPEHVVVGVKLLLNVLSGRNLSRLSEVSKPRHSVPSFLRITSHGREP